MPRTTSSLHRQATILLLSFSFALTGTVARAQIVLETGRADLVLTGEETDGRPEQLGAALALSADLDGDGRLDYAIGAPHSDCAGENSGCVYIHSSRTGQRLRTISGPFPGALFGSSLADAGDVNADGVRDLLVGAPSYLNRVNDPGHAYVFSGVDARTLRVLHGELSGVSTGRSFGAALDGAGDVDGDGHADLIIADPEYTEINRPLVRGAVYLYSGKTGALRYRIVSPDPLDYFGTAVAGAGDVDGDGRPDIAVGAPFSDGHQSAPLPNCGRLRVYSGRTGQVLLDRLGTHEQDRLGMSVDRLPDMTGAPRIIVGAPSFRGIGAGSVLIINPHQADPLHSFEGMQDGEMFGAHVRRIGDIDLDGAVDVAIAAPRRGRIPAIISPFYQPGAVDLFSGRTGERMTTLTPRPASSELFEIAVLGELNTDDDDAAEILIGDAENRVLLFQSPLSCAADFSGDSVVSALDMAILLTQWGETNPRFNLAGSDEVDALDIATLLSAWGPCAD